MIKLMPGLPGNVVGVVAGGAVTEKEYERVLIPAVDAAVGALGRVRLLIQLAPGFTGHTVGAMWDEARLGLAHLTAWEKVAVVTDSKGLRGAMVFLRVLARCPVKVFGSGALEEAKAWIVE